MGLTALRYFLLSGPTSSGSVEEKTFRFGASDVVKNLHDGKIGASSDCEDAGPTSLTYQCSYDESSMLILI